MKRLFACTLIALFFSSCLTPGQKELKRLGLKKGMYARIHTEKGSFIVNLEYRLTPLTVANFVGLAEGIIPNEFRKKGEPFYNGLKFHKVYQNEMLIGGCPKGDGTGHPGYLFKDEIVSRLRHDVTGTLSMQHFGPVTNGSQFIISLKPLPALDGQYTRFGQVVSGMETVQRIQQGDKMTHIEIIPMGSRAKRFDPLKVFESEGFGQIKINP